MTFSVLYWNIWLDNQINGEAAAQPLLDELQNICEQYQPDYIGLNEVLQHIDEPAPFISIFLQKQGYHTANYHANSPIVTDWLIGNGFYCKRPIKNFEEVILGIDRPAVKRGFPGHNLKATVANLPEGISIVLTHHIHLRIGRHITADHYREGKALSAFVRERIKMNPLILGGDFNEPNFLPRSFQTTTKDVLHHRTGTYRNPTWRHKTSRKTPVRASLDKLFWSKSPKLKLLHFEIIAVDISDHRPLLATFEMVEL